MKKLVLCSLVAGAVTCICISGDAFAACGATSRCGGKTVTTFAAGLAASATGAVVGGTLGLLAGPVGAGVTGIAVGTWAGFKGAKIAWDNGYDANEYIYFSDGTCLECDGISDLLDTGQECRNNQYFTNGIDLFRCDGPADTKKDDKWVKETVSVCSDSPVKNMIDGKTYELKLKGAGETKISVGGADGFVYSSKPCRYIEEITKNCTHQGKTYKVNDEISYCSDVSQCKSLTHKCGADGVFHCQESTLQCVEGYKPKANGKCGECEKDKDPTPPKQTCEQTYAGYPERIACCKHPLSVTTWEPKGATPTNGRCECVDKKTKWTYVRGEYTGQCMPAGGCSSLSGDAKLCCEAGGTWNETTKTCDCGEGRNWDTAKKQCVQDDSNVLSDCIYRFNGKVKCANGNFVYITESHQLTKAELGGMTSCDAFNNMYQADVAKLNQFFAKYCAGSAIISVVTGPSAAEVESAKSTLSAFFSAAQSNASVWKNAEGKFNTARLASDLTAGVVLGSVGGVVSGVVIKKKQVQKGFEALHCAVGGQTIADWGDEFNVGLRR